MTDDLAAYLDAIDARLVGYLDADGHLSDGAVRQVQRYAVALVQRLIIPAHVKEDWPDFFPLADAFVLAYGSARLGYLARQSILLVGGGGGPLTDVDRPFLVALIAEMYKRLAETER